VLRSAPIAVAPHLCTGRPHRGSTSVRTGTIQVASRPSCPVLRARRIHAATGATTHSATKATKSAASGIIGPVLFTPCRTTPETATSARSTTVARTRTASMGRGPESDRMIGTSSHRRRPSSGALRRGRRADLRRDLGARPRARGRSAAELPRRARVSRRADGESAERATRLPRRDALLRRAVTHQLDRRGAVRSRALHNAVANARLRTADRRSAARRARCG